jgi:subtilisin family serine protease
MKGIYSGLLYLFLVLVPAAPTYGADLSVLVPETYALTGEKQINKDTWTYSYKLGVRNNGGAPLKNVCGTAESISSMVNIVGEKICFAEIPPGQVVTSKESLSLQTRKHPYTPSDLKWTFTSLVISVDPSVLAMEKGTTKTLSYTVTFSTSASKLHRVNFHRHAPHHLKVTNVPGGWETDHSATWNVKEQVTANEIGEYTITAMTSVPGLGQHTRMRVPVVVTDSVTGSRISKPTSWPLAINPGQAKVTFTVAVPSAARPASVILERETSNGWKSNAVLHDNGQGGDLKAHDAIYSATIPVAVTDEGVLWFRARAEGFGASEPYGLAVTAYPIGPAPPDPRTYTVTRGGMPFVGNRLLVTVAGETNSGQIEAVLRPVRGKVVGTLPGPGSYHVEIPFTGNAAGVIDAIRSLQAVPSVLFVEPDYLARPSANPVVPSDSSYLYQWGLKYIGADYAWHLTHGKGMIVAVVDSGVDYSHAELTATVPCGSQQCARVVNGTNYTVTLTDPSRNDPMDDTGHGTHVAGIIAAAANNSPGTMGNIAGIAWESQIRAIKACDVSGCTSANIASAIAEAAAAQVKIINISLELRDPSTNVSKPSWHVQHQVEEASKNKILVVIAAGNNENTSHVYPAAYVTAWDSNPDPDDPIAVTTSPDPSLYAIAVAMVDSSGNFRTSTYGTWVPLAAPGYNIYSLLPGNAHDVRSGTSAAAPHVSATAALLWAANSGWSAGQVRSRLEDTATPLAGVAKGIVDAKAALGPIIVWDTPSPITYGTPLGPAQQNASATVAGGGYDYTPQPGAILNAGPQTLSVTFTPTNSNLYSAVTKTVMLTVNQAPAQINFDPNSLEQTYDGKAKQAGFTTTPSGLSASVTYNGSATLPVNIGTYNVVVTINNINYSGSNTATLVIKEPHLSAPPNFRIEPQ